MRIAARLEQWIRGVRPPARLSAGQSARARGHLRRDVTRSFLSTLMFLAGVGAGYVTFVSVIPRARLMAWIYASVTWHMIWLFVLLFMLVRQPDHDERNRLWWPMGLVVGMGTISLMIWSVWLFMPYATEQLRLMYMLLSVTFVSIAIMTGNERANLDRFAAIGVLGSLAVFFLLNGGPYALILAGFIFAYALAMLGLSSNMRAASAALVKAKREAEAERDARARFIASASHDLGQPLQAARLFFDQVLRSEGVAKRDKAVRGVNWAFDTSERLIRQMIDHLRLEAGAVEAEMGDVALGLLIAQMAEHQEPAARIAGVRIIAMPSRLTVRADPALIERALGNLVGNAIRHAKATRVLIGARAIGGRVRLWVIDDGNGIPAADLPRLFDDYAQGSDHGSEVRGGFGLGLASARRMAKLMGGSAGLETRWTGGSAFWIELAGNWA